MFSFKQNVHNFEQNVHNFEQNVRNFKPNNQSLDIFGISNKLIVRDFSSMLY